MAGRSAVTKSSVLQWLIVLLVAAWLVPLRLPLVDRADSAGYLAVTTSLVEDGDLLFLDEYRRLELWERYARPTSTGLLGNHWTLGLGLAFVPAYRLGAVFAPERPAPSAPAYAAFQATALLWLLGTLLAIGALLRRLGLPAWVPTLAIYLGTPLLYYAHTQGVRPHVLESLLLAAFVLLVFTVRERSIPRALALGGLAGALYLVRPQMAAIAVFVVWEQVWVLWDGREHLRAMLRSEVVRAAAFGFPLSVCLWLSARYTRLLYGDVPTSFLDGVFAVEFDLVASLVHPHHGLFAWSPILLPACIGLALFIRRERRWLVPMLVFAGVQVYLNGTSFDQSVDAYHYTRHVAGGFSFGARRYVGCMPLFAIGLAELWRRASAVAWQRLALAGVALAAVVWNLGLFIHANRDPSILMEPLDGARLFELQRPTLVGWPDACADWVERVPSGPVMLVGWFVAAAQAVALVVVWRFVRSLPWRWHTPGSLVLTLATAVFVVRGWIGVEARTVRAVREHASGLERFRANAERRTTAIARDILIEQARLAALFGHPQRSLAKYNAALELGHSDALAREQDEVAKHAGLLYAGG